jgi:serine/threonine-protein kinase
MATVYLGWLAAPADFTRVVAIKTLLPRLAFDEHFVSCFQDEARLNACLSHPNIVQVFDVVGQGRELLIVMEYVDGVPLNGLVQDANAQGLRLPLPIVAGVLAPALHALHALHEATDDQGKAIGIVHRDFTPPNIMVTREGYSKLLDLGVAKARIHEHVTLPGKFAGKLGYCSPEQIRTGDVDRRTDVFAAGIVLWELLTGKHLFHHPESENETIRCVLQQPIPAPSSVNPDVPKALDEVVLRATRRAPECRFATARELAFALEAAIDPARPPVIADWLAGVCAHRLAKLSRRLERTRRCMARTRVGAVLAESSTEKATVRQPRPTAAITRPVQNTGAQPGSRFAHRLKSLALGAIVLALATGGTFGRRLLSQPATPSTRPAPTPQAAQVRRPSPEIVLLPSPPPAPIPSLEIPPAPVVAAVPEEKQNPETPARARVQLTKARALSPKPRRPRAPPPRTPVVRQLASQPDCNPPTYLGEDGIRYFKLECL